MDNTKQVQKIEECEDSKSDFDIECSDDNEHDSESSGLGAAKKQSVLSLRKGSISCMIIVCDQGIVFIGKRLPL